MNDDGTFFLATFVAVGGSGGVWSHVHMVCVVNDLGGGCDVVVGVFCVFRHIGGEETRELGHDVVVW